MREPHEKHPLQKGFKKKKGKQSLDCKLCGFHFDAPKLGAWGPIVDTGEIVQKSGLFPQNIFSGIKASFITASNSMYFHRVMVDSV